MSNTIIVTGDILVSDACYLADPDEVLDSNSLCINYLKTPKQGQYTTTNILNAPTLKALLDIKLLKSTGQDDEELGDIDYNFIHVVMHKDDFEKTSVFLGELEEICVDGGNVAVCNKDTVSKVFPKILEGVDEYDAWDEFCKNIDFDNEVTWKDPVAAGLPHLACYLTKNGDIESQYCTILCRKTKQILGVILIA